MVAGQYNGKRMKAVAAILCALALILSIVATVSLLNASLYRGIETSCTENGWETVETTQTLVEMNGSWVVYQLGVVILISGLPLFALMFRR